MVHYYLYSFIHGRSKVVKCKLLTLPFNFNLVECCGVVPLKFGDYSEPLHQKHVPNNVIVVNINN